MKIKWDLRVKICWKFMSEMMKACIVLGKNKNEYWKYSWVCKWLNDICSLILFNNIAQIIEICKNQLKEIFSERKNDYIFKCYASIVGRGSNSLIAMVIISLHFCK